MKAGGSFTPEGQEKGAAWGESTNEDLKCLREAGREALSDRD